MISYLDWFSLARVRASRAFSDLPALWCTLASSIRYFVSSIRVDKSTASGYEKWELSSNPPNHETIL